MSQTPKKSSIISNSTWTPSEWICRYDGQPCTHEMQCFGCDRMDLGKFPNSEAQTEYIVWGDDYEGNGVGFPLCPSCREPAYGMMESDENGVGQCPFCGQHYQYDEEGRKKAEPAPEETHDCPNCGQHTMTGRREKSNGHFNGRCTSCGTRIIG